jgi:hypothetical protein
MIQRTLGATVHVGPAGPGSSTIGVGRDLFDADAQVGQAGDPLRVPLRVPSQRQNDARRRRPVCDRRAVRLVWFDEGGGAACAELLATVPHWFGIAEANEKYRRVASPIGARLSSPWRMGERSASSRSSATPHTPRNLTSWPFVRNSIGTGSVECWSLRRRAGCDRRAWSTCK